MALAALAPLGTPPRRVGGVAAAGGVRERLSATAAGRSKAAGAGAAAMADAGDVALAFMARWGEGLASLRSSIADYFDDDTVWENVGMNRLVGRQAALAFIDSFHQRFGLDRIRVDTLAILSQGSVVLTERVDHLLRADGTIIASVRLMGTFELRRHRILAQRDYFCPASSG